MEFEFSNKILEYALRIVGILAFASFIVFIVWFRPNADEMNRSFLKDVTNLSFQGKVDSMYQDKPNHNADMLILEHGGVYGFPREWKRYIEVGDSLSKKQNESILKIRKKNGKVIIIDYKEL